MFKLTIATVFKNKKHVLNFSDLGVEVKRKALESIIGKC
jgi:hypothetical protein